MKRHNTLDKIYGIKIFFSTFCLFKVAKSVQMSSEVLMGVVALVEVGAESRALALRAALGALGASVVPAWSPIVTHVVWTQGELHKLLGTVPY